MTVATGAAGETTGSPSLLPVLRVTDIGEYIRHHSCARRLKLQQEEASLRKGLPFYSRLFNPIDPALKAAGASREDEAEQDLVNAGYRDLTNYRERRATDDPKMLPSRWADFVALLARLPKGAKAYGREVQVQGQIGRFLVQGRIDFVLLEWEGDRPLLRLIECKASRRDKTYQRIQAAAYQIIVSELLNRDSLSIDDCALRGNSVQASVARIDEGTERIQPIPPLEALNLEMECADLFQMLAPDGQVSKVLESDLESLAFEIATKCDHCKFNVVCLPEAGRTRALELIGADPAVCRAMRSVGINSLRELEILDLDGPVSALLRSVPGFAANLLRLQRLASVRSTTLPGGAANPDEYEVTALPWRPKSQCPPYFVGDQPVVRIYLGVHYDYVENRIGALAAHVTTSEWRIHTPFEEAEPKKWRPVPTVRERRKVSPAPPATEPTWEERALPSDSCRDVCRYQPGPWSSNFDMATGQEGQLLQSFFDDLINAIAIVAPADRAPIHIYVWSRGELSQLIEGCLRANTRALSSLQELLGCREPLEQLVFSCLQEDVDRGYALGWTGRGLSVASSLRWMGGAFHWTRRIGREVVALDWIFRQDLFDFKTQLDLLATGDWADEGAPGSTKHTFEIRSRFNDTLTAPYWRAVWGTLTPPTTPGLDAQQRRQLERYYEAAKPNYLPEFLISRTHALRWIEGAIWKNEEIEKVPLDVTKLRTFSLGIDTPAAAAIDFLRLDYHVKKAAWIATHMAPTADRVASGASLPLRDVRVNSDGILEGFIDATGYGTDLEILRNRATVRDFARLSPRFQDPNSGQTIKQLLVGGSTCRDVSVDWATGRVTMEAMYHRGGRYIAQSRSFRPGDDGFDFATLDESVTDFVSPRVDERLVSVVAHRCYTFFDPRGPVVPEQAPLSAHTSALVDTTLRSLRVRGGSGLEPDQLLAAIQGLNTKIQLLQGPPGTGKTGTTAASILARLCARLRPGQVAIIAAHTHTAVDELMLRVNALLPEFKRVAGASGLPVPEITLFRVEGEPLDGIATLRPDAAVRPLSTGMRTGVVLIGGTTNALLKLAGKLDESASFGRRPAGFQGQLLIVDEASMMVYSHFLALTSLVSTEAQFMLAGDHRQLAPIVAHDWDEEDRYPVTLYQPFVSAFEAVRNIKSKCSLNDQQVLASRLRFTFRLPEVVRELIRPVYVQDDIELEGGAGTPTTVRRFDPSEPWSAIWADRRALFLIVHDEAESSKANATEIEIIEALLNAGNMLREKSVVVMTPHRAQRSMLGQRLSGRPEIKMIDTVERMQGGECPVVIISATSSDSAAITRNAEFILDLNRANVAFSRTQERLIVVCARTLLENVPADLENYQSALLWKSIRELCREEIATIIVGHHSANVYTVAPPAP